MLLCGLQMLKHADKEGFIPFVPHSRGIGKYGWVGTFLLHGFQVRLLANHMLFGLCNALVTFQWLIQNTLEELNLMHCVIYLDDVIVFGCMEEEHLECLCIIFEKFQEFNLKLKPPKCMFFQLEIVYLAHHIL